MTNEVLAACRSGVCGQQLGIGHERVGVFVPGHDLLVLGQLHDHVQLFALLVRSLLVLLVLVLYHLVELYAVLVAYVLHYVDLFVHRVQLGPYHHAFAVRFPQVLLILPQRHLVEPLDRELLTRVGLLHLRKWLRHTHLLLAVHSAVLARSLNLHGCQLLLLRRRLLLEELACNVLAKLYLAEAALRQLTLLVYRLIDHSVLQHVFCRGLAFTAGGVLRPRARALPANLAEQERVVVLVL